MVMNRCDKMYGNEGENLITNSRIKYNEKSVLRFSRNNLAS